MAITENKTRGPGRPHIVRTGGSGRSGKEYNVLDMVYKADNINIPASVYETINRSFADEWWKAMQTEYNALLSNNTWELTDLPAGQKGSLACGSLLLLLP